MGLLKTAIISLTEVIVIPCKETRKCAWSNYSWHERDAFSIFHLQRRLLTCMLLRCRFENATGFDYKKAQKENQNSLLESILYSSRK